MNLDKKSENDSQQLKVESKQIVNSSPAEKDTEKKHNDVTTENKSDSNVIEQKMTEKISENKVETNKKDSDKEKRIEETKNQKFQSLIGPAGSTDQTTYSLMSPMSPSRVV